MISTVHGTKRDGAKFYQYRRSLFPTCKYIDRIFYLH